MGNLIPIIIIAIIWLVVVRLVPKSKRVVVNIIGAFVLIGTALSLTLRQLGML